MLRKIEAFLQPSKLEGLRDLLLKLGIEGMSVTEARGFGSRSQLSGSKPQFEQRIKVEIVLEESQVDETIRQIRQLAGAGTIGAGKIFVIPVEDALRLSTREAGRSAIF